MAMPKTMKAAILVEQRKPLVVDDIELPDSLDVGQVLVKIQFSGICGSQLGEIDGAKARTSSCRICWVMRHPEALWKRARA